MEGLGGPRVSSTPAVLVSQHRVDGTTTAQRKRKRNNEEVAQLRKQGETHLADKIMAAQARGETRVQIRHMKQKHRRKASETTDATDPVSQGGGAKTVKNSKQAE